MLSMIAQLFIAHVIHKYTSLGMHYMYWTEDKITYTHKR